MKLHVNRISKIKNGGIALEIPTNRVEELNQVLKIGFEARYPKINKPKFKIFDVPADLDKEKSSIKTFQTMFLLRIFKQILFLCLKQDREMRMLLSG